MPAAQTAVHWARVRDGRPILIRRTEPEDEAALQRFVITLDALSRRQRFFSPLRELNSAMLARLVRQDAPVGGAVMALAGPQWTEVAGLAEYDAAGAGEAEAAVLVGERWRRVGLAWALLAALVGVAAAAGIGAVRAHIQRDNGAALSVARKLGCAIDTRVRDVHAVHVVRSISLSDQFIRSAAPMALS